MIERFGFPPDKRMDFQNNYGDLGKPEAVKNYNGQRVQH